MPAGAGSGSASQAGECNLLCGGGCIRSLDCAGGCSLICQFNSALRCVHGFGTELLLAGLFVEF